MWAKPGHLEKGRGSTCLRARRPKPAPASPHEAAVRGGAGATTYPDARSLEKPRCPVTSVPGRGGGAPTQPSARGRGSPHWTQQEDNEAPHYNLPAGTSFRLLTDRAQESGSPAYSLDATDTTPGDSWFKGFFGGKGFPFWRMTVEEAHGRCRQYCGRWCGVPST